MVVNRTHMKKTTQYIEILILKLNKQIKKKPGNIFVLKAED